MSGTTIYCAKCKTNHHLTPVQAEVVIQTLAAEWADAAVSDEVTPGFEGEHSDEVCYGWCALDHLGWVQDGESYYEHIEAMRESRLAVKRASS
jgi:hypothetical protein